MKYLHYEFDLTNDVAVKIALKNQANVKLLDPINYSNYQKGRKYTYHGGLAKKSPIILKAPHSGKWHLVIDLGGSAGSISASVDLVSL
ncbi:MAG TPA: DUF1883 domain-containing protein [Cytophagaceae bacterium]|jgi:hypothetical protein|nr:DUF1883 domain-containing protein [Cytophagaceae bacterium]